MKTIAYILPVLVLCLSCGNSDRNVRDTKERSPIFPWTHFRGGAGLHGVVNDTIPIPDTLKLLWSFKANGACISSPVTDGSVIYIGSLDSTLYALDIHTGNVVWKIKAEDEIEASPVIHNDVILIGDLGGNFYSVNKADGSQNWRFTAKDKIAGSANVIPNKDLVVFGSYDNNLYCLDINTGKLIWQYASGNYINGTPATDGERVVFGGCDAGVHVVGADDGSLIGKIDTESYIAGSAVLRDGFAYLGSYGRSLFMIDIGKMGIAWKYESSERRQPYVASPALADTFLIAPSRDKFIHCVSSITGNLIWKFPAKGAVDGSPVVSDNRVIAGCNAGYLYIIDLTTGALVNSLDMGGPLSGSPLVVGGMIIIGDDNGVISALSK